MRGVLWIVLVCYSPNIFSRGLIFVATTRLLIHPVSLRILSIISLGCSIRPVWVTIGLLRPKVCDIDEIEVVLKAFVLVSYKK